MNNKLNLWYDRPAKDWNESLPTGNGRLGAMIYGGVFQEKIQVNEDSVWYGNFRNRNNPDAKEYFPKIRKYLLEGNLDKAHELAKYALSGIPESQRNYQSLGDILLEFPDKCDKYTGYRRELDLNNAVVRVFYNINGTEYKREVFTSYLDNVTVMKISANKEKSINLTGLLRRGNYIPNSYLCGSEKYFDTVKKISKEQIILYGNCGEGGIKFSMSLKAKTVGGKVNVIGEHLIIKGADEVTLYFSAATTFRYNNYDKKCCEFIDNALMFDFKKLYNRHVKDYKNLFERVNLEIQGDNNDNYDDWTTDKRLKEFNKNNDVGFINLYYQFCRYLLISSSREGSLPATLQGIWCNGFSPEWDSKYTININTEMNYWGVEISNLSECHVPLFEHLERMVVNGRYTAKEMYNCRGFVAHHNTDIWGDTAPQDIVDASTYWLMGGAWLSLHIWEHYLYTKDIKFLEKYYYILKSAAEFFVDYLIENDKGQYITCPSISPENTYLLAGKEYALCSAPAMDSQILYELFRACIKCSEILSLDKEFANLLQKYINKLPKIQIGSKGQILEWNKEYEEKEKGHRHFSHLFALCPGTQIDVEKTPQLADAAKVSIDNRIKNGSAHTGWSRVWVINFYARLREGNKAFHHLCKLFELSTLPNLFNSHPPFQIDGNLGSICAISEMLVQSHNEVILLPAIPDNWVNGRVEGLKIRGNIEVDLYWSKRALTKANFKAPIDKILDVKYKEKCYKVKLINNKKTELNI